MLTKKSCSLNNSQMEKLQEQSNTRIKSGICKDGFTIN